MSLIGTLEEFQENAARGIVAEGRSLLVVRRGEELYIYENSCPHTRESLDPMGGSVASPDGLLLQCQRHAAEFISSTGECVAGPCQGEYLTAVGVTVSGGDIYLD
jgi:nitrite reductase/ring-hydroxylating ferredoxin subunit